MDDEIQITEWYAPGGGMMYRRDALDWDHPESTYQQIIKMGKIPEAYGIYPNQDIESCFKTMQVVRRNKYEATPDQVRYLIACLSFYTKEVEEFYDNEYNY